jgi:PEP-CTERM motif
MKLKHIAGSAAIAAAALCGSAANAELYNFNLGGDYSATWQIDTDNPPDYVDPGSYIAFYDVAGNFEGALGGYADVGFYHIDSGGGLDITDYVGNSVLLVTDGPQLYGGSDEHPTFLAGTYTLTEFLGEGTYTLTISAVPEPATYGMLLAGIGLVGAALRRHGGR